LKTADPKGFVGSNPTPSARPPWPVANMEGQPYLIKVIPL